MCRRLGDTSGDGGGDKGWEERRWKKRRWEWQEEEDEEEDLFRCNLLTFT